MSAQTNTTNPAVSFTVKANPSARADSARFARSCVAHQRAIERIASATYSASARSTYPLPATSKIVGTPATIAAASHAQSRPSPRSRVQPNTAARSNGKNANVTAPNAASPARVLTIRPRSMAHTPCISAPSAK